MAPRTHKIAAIVLCIFSGWALLFAADQIAKELKAAGHCVGSCAP